MDLHLNDAVKNEVNNSSQRYIKNNGRRLIIKVSPFHLREGLHFKNNPNSLTNSVLVPLDEMTISSLSSVESFVKTQLSDSDKYKPIWLERAMYVQISKWCTFDLVKSSGKVFVLPEDVMFGAGMYSIDLQVSHLYNGPHRGGETCSLSLFVVNVSYEPQSNMTEIIQEISDFV